jgi:hypothetical protein
MGVRRGPVMLEETLQRGKARKRTPCGQGEQDREQPYRGECRERA